MKYTEKNMLLTLDRYNYLINQCKDSLKPGNNPTSVNTNETKSQAYSLSDKEPSSQDTVHTSHQPDLSKTETPAATVLPDKHNQWLTQGLHKTKSILSTKAKAGIPKKHNSKTHVKTSNKQTGGKQITHPKLSKTPRKPTSKTMLVQLLNALHHTLLKQSGTNPNPLVYRLIDHMRHHKGKFSPANNGIIYRGKILKLPHLAKIIMYMLSGKQNEKFLKEQTIFNLFLQETNFQMPPHLNVNNKLKTHWLTN